MCTRHGLWFILIGFAFLAAVGYYAGVREPEPVDPSLDVIVTEDQATDATITQDDESGQILQDLEKGGIECGGKCTVETVTVDYAKGLMPMAYWIAMRTGGVWQVIITGNGIPECREIDVYEVPRDIYGNCIEQSGELRF